MSKSTGETQQIRIPTMIARKAGVIAAARGISLPKYIEERLGPLVDEDLVEVNKLLGMEPQAEKGSETPPRSRKK